MTTDYKLIAKLGNLKTVIQLLRAVNFKESATCYGSKNGLKLTVEEAKCMQASAYIPIQLFEEYTLTEDIIFRINLNVFVECLSMFWSNINTTGSTTSLEMHYKGVGHPVTILIEEDGVVVDCSLKTQEPDEILDFDLDPETVINKVLLHSELLKDVLAELDPTSNHLELLLSPKSPYFMISTKGLAGECHVQMPHNTEMIETFQCKKEAKSKYLLPHIKPAMKAMLCSNKVSLRTNESGLLCFQYMIKTDDGVNCFIEYYISPLINDDDD
ncbi:cell cycle checkpoint protein RAD1 [Trichogramma pretiosum]|uniref:cell cycle checkpoint protein RAD1 n=1 Tax=Trichogramma pretiosum TaxID=7493 RepID=UPI0006C991E4|nr:cell cycle checkpoint protein RAD1 [Trichogramma pretiosum]